MNQFEGHDTRRQKPRKVATLNGISRGGSLNLGSNCKLRQPCHDPPADVLKLHASLFTEPKVFCPRTLKSAALSRVRNLACYNPPRRSQAAEHLEEFDLRRSQKPSLLNDHQSRDPDLPSKPVFRSPTSASVHTPSRKADSVRSGARRSAQKTMEDIEYLKFSSAVTDDILINRQFSNRSNS
uniref:Spermatogenesis associated protein 7 n=1 Tax=Echinococcus granulosus TaxID=6210 RepID=A0A068WAE8_ECHGR|nr:spermatogenesis associated protein 7 [Echinococcus granulosus]